MNRKVVASITVMFLLSPVLLSLGAKAQYSWPMFHNNPSHTGYTSGPGPTTNQTLWIYETLYDIWGPCPIVVNGMLYIGGGWGPILYALNATTGGSMWNYTTWAWIASTPSVVDNVVYFSSYNTNVTSLDASTGALIWNYTTGDFLAASSPCVVNDVLYIGGGWGNIVYALNTTTGLQIWNYTTEDQVHSSPAVADGIVYVGSSDYNVYALNATTGAKIWNYTTGFDVFSYPAVVEGIVYVGSSDDNVYALNATT